MKTHLILSNTITTLDTAKAFLTYLYDNGLSYHCEDSAADCIGHLLAPDECAACDSRMAECYRQDFGDSCPCGFTLELDPDYLRNMIANRREDLDRIGLDALGRSNGPDFTPDENRECGELTRDIERLETLLAEREAKLETA